MKFTMSTSAPNILEFERDPLLNADIKVQVMQAQTKSASILLADINESCSHEDVYHYRYQPVEQDEHFLNPQLCEWSVRTNKQPIFVTDGEKNQKHNHHHRSELNSFRKARRRAVLKNGDCNIVQVHIAERGRRYLQDIFTTLVDTQWRWTFLAFFMSFLLSWFGFALIWWLIAFSHGDLLAENQGNSSWIPCVTNINGFAACFLFSMETQHSTGYGSRYPTTECMESIFLVSIQSIIGVMIQAFMVGIVFAKMARPKQRKQTLLFSRNCVICQRDGQLCLMFRVGDMREKSHLINSTIHCYLVYARRTQEGELLSPHMHELKVQVDDYNQSVMLIWPLIVVHKIDIESPLYEMSAAELLQEKIEIVAVLEGTSESTGQTTQVRTSYDSSEILWGHRFEPIVKYDKEKLSYEVDYDLFHNTYEVDTPLCSAKELQQILLSHSDTSI